MGERRGWIDRNDSGEPFVEKEGEASFPCVASEESFVGCIDREVDDEAIW